MNSKPSDSPWQVVRGRLPIVATSIHDGHDLREEVADLMILPEADRFREEDPYTLAWTAVADTRIQPSRSRFEVDLNRPRERAVYRVPEDAWGLEMWKRELPDALVERSLSQYDRFYEEAGRLFGEMEKRFGHFLILDLHTYNHRRAGPGQPPDDPEANPEVNVGTGTLDRELWASLVERFIGDMAGFDFLGRQLDVRENVRFRGGYFSRWIHENFPGSACCLAVEFKKFFMDEWTGKLDEEAHEAITRALAAAVPGLHETLGTMASG